MTMAALISAAVVRPLGGLGAKQFQTLAKDAERLVQTVKNSPFMTLVNSQAVKPFVAVRHVTTVSLNLPNHSFQQTPLHGDSWLRFKGLGARW